MVYVLPCLLFLLIPLHAMSTTPLSDWSMSGANTCLVGHSENHDWNETGSTHASDIDCTDIVALAPPVQSIAVSALCGSSALAAALASHVFRSNCDALLCVHQFWLQFLLLFCTI